MNLLAIDPGPEKSAYMLLEDGVPKSSAWESNHHLLDLCDDFRQMNHQWQADHLAIEYVYLRGMKVYQQAIDTIFWAGRFTQAWNGTHTLIDRRDVKAVLCGNQKADNTSIKYSIIDNYFGGKAKAIGGVKCKSCKGKGWRGRKHEPCEDCHHEGIDRYRHGLVGCGYETHPGPLHDISGKGSEHIWQALAVGLTHLEMNCSICGYLLDNDDKHGCPNCHGEVPN
jgi:Holliday junction resolvasome RuvABC endonuclease subunit